MFALASGLDDQLPVAMSDGTASVRFPEEHVVGRSCPTWVSSEAANRPARKYEIPDGKAADLTALRRAAIARAAPAFPAETPVAPFVENGSLMIIGGGRVTEEMWRQFVKLAGGPEAQIVIVPTAVENPQLGDRRDVREFKDAGAKTVTVLHTISPNAAGSRIWRPSSRRFRSCSASASTSPRR